MLDIKQIIKDTIKPNGEGQITGGTLQGTLLAMVSALDGGAFRGILTPERCTPEDYDAAKAAEEFDKSQKWWYILFPGKYALPSKNSREWIYDNSPIEELVGIPKLQVFAHYIGIYYSDGHEIALITQRYEPGQRKIIFGRWLPKCPNIGDIYIIPNGGIDFRNSHVPRVKGRRAAIQIIAPFRNDESIFDCANIIDDFDIAPAETQTKRFNPRIWTTEYLGIPNIPGQTLRPKRVTCLRPTKTSSTVGRNSNGYLKSMIFTDATTGERIKLRRSKIGMTRSPSILKLPTKVPYYYLVRVRHYKLTKGEHGVVKAIVPARISVLAYKFVARKFRGRKTDSVLTIAPENGEEFSVVIPRSGYPRNVPYKNVGIVEYSVVTKWGGEILSLR